MDEPLKLLPEVYFRTSRPLRIRRHRVRKTPAPPAMRLFAECPGCGRQVTMRDMGVQLSPLCMPCVRREIKSGVDSRDRVIVGEDEEEDRWDLIYSIVRNSEHGWLSNGEPSLGLVLDLVREFGDQLTSTEVGVIFGVSRQQSDNYRRDALRRFREEYEE